MALISERKVQGGGGVSRLCQPKSHLQRRKWKRIKEQSISLWPVSSHTNPQAWLPARGLHFMPTTDKVSRHVCTSRTHARTSHSLISPYISCVDNDDEDDEEGNINTKNSSSSSGGWSSSSTYELVAGIKQQNEMRTPGTT